MGEKIELKNIGVDSELEKIWLDYHINDIAPLHPKELRRNAVTYLSLNPSLPPKLEENVERGFKVAPPYSLVDCQKEKAEYPFFQKFYNLNKGLMEEWTVLDLLYERVSNQTILEKRYECKDISEETKLFLFRQIKLTFRILSEIQPRIVVISNALTDRLIHNNMQELCFTQELPCEENNYVYRINEIPFIRNESRFLGSRIHLYNKERIEKLQKEIKRVLRFVKK